MTDFEAALRAKLDRNEELNAQRAQAEREMDRAQQEQAAAAERERAKQHDARTERHSALVDALTQAANGLKNQAPDDYVVRLGWTESGEEFIAKISTRQTWPARSLLIELDRDDDEVLARWHTDLGNALELWRLLEVDPDLLQALVLQVADAEAWRHARRPLPFPQPEE